MFKTGETFLRYFTFLTEREKYTISLVCSLLTNLPYFIFNFSLKYEFTIILRVLSLACFLSFIFSHFFYERYIKFASFLWISNIIFSLIYIPFINLLLHQGSLITTINFIISLFFMGFFSHWRIIFIHSSLIMLCLCGIVFYEIVLFPSLSLKIIIYSLISLNAAGLPLLKIHQEHMGETKRSFKKIIFSIAHEIRTPLASINLLCAQALKDKSSKNFSELSKIKSINNKCIQMIDFLVSFFRKEIMINLKKVDLEKFLKRFIEENFKREKDKSIIQVMIEENATLDLDETILFHVLNNITKNAIYQINKNRKGYLLIRLRKKEGTVFLSLKDTSSGIKPETLPLIFDEFFSTKDNNLGIGLHFSKKAVEAMGGRIVCRSIQHEFTDFELIFKEKG